MQRSSSDRTTAADVRGQRVEAGGEVQQIVRVQPQEPGHRGAVAAVGPGLEGRTVIERSGHRPMTVGFT